MIPASDIHIALEKSPANPAHTTLHTTSASDIHIALEKSLAATGLFDRITRAAQDDLEKALRDLRDNSEAHAILIPTGEEIIHELLDDNTPLRAEIRSKMSLLITGENADRLPQAGEDLPVKDQLLQHLMWASLGNPNLIILPLATEPIRVEFDGGASRDAFRIDLEARQVLHS